MSDNPELASTRFETDQTNFEDGFQNPNCVCVSCQLHRQRIADLLSSLLWSRRQCTYFENCHHLDRFVINELERHLFLMQVAHSQVLQQLTCLNFVIANLQYALHEYATRDEQTQLKLQLQRDKIHDLQSLVNSQRELESQLFGALNSVEKMDTEIAHCEKRLREEKQSSAELASVNEKLSEEISEKMIELTGFHTAMKLNDEEREKSESTYREKIIELEKIISQNQSHFEFQRGHMKEMDKEKSRLSNQVKKLETALSSSQARFSDLNTKYSTDVKKAEENALIGVETRISRGEKKVQEACEKEIAKYKQFISQCSADLKIQQHKYEQAMKKISSIEELSEENEEYMKENFKQTLGRSVQHARQLQRELDEAKAIIEEVIDNNNSCFELMRDTRDQTAIIISNQPLQLYELIEDLSPRKDWSHVKFDEKHHLSFIAMIFLILHRLLDECDPLLVLEEVKDMRLRTFYVLKNR